MTIDRFDEAAEGLLMPSEDADEVPYAAWLEEEPEPYMGEDYNLWEEQQVFLDQEWSDGMDGSDGH